MRQAILQYLTPTFLLKLVTGFVIFLGTCLISGCMDLAPGLNNVGKESHSPSYKLGAVYTMRGGLGGIFSTGMSDLQKKLHTRYHISSASTIWFKADTLSDHIIKNYQSGEVKAPIILIGHSLGANEQIKVARSLGEAGIPVALLITVDAVAPIKVSANVKHVINLYTPGYIPMLSGQVLVAASSQSTRIDNIDVSHINGVAVNHLTIDKHNAIQALMLKNVLAVLNSANHLR